jgi:hypothetical protein
MRDINIDGLMQNPAFDALEPERKQAFAELFGRVQGKGNMEAAVIISDFLKKLPKGKELSAAEQNAMLEALLEAMPDKERGRYRTLFNVIRAMKPSS